MPNLSFSQALTANQRGFNPFSGWQYEFAPYPCRIKFMVRCTTAGGQVTLYTGSDTVQERSIIQAAGVAGTTPSELNTAPVIYLAAGGDRLKAAIDEVLGGTPTVDGLIVLDPI